MDRDKISYLTPLILRFYAKCFVYPYEEMNYELQHLFRQIEKEATEAEEVNHLDQILNIINAYQGEDIKDLRDDYVALFSSFQDETALCPMFASEFFATSSTNYNPDPVLDLLWESGIPINPDEPLDSVINYLEYYSLLCEKHANKDDNFNEIVTFRNKHILNWIPQFCDMLSQAANVSFYREVGYGLFAYLQWL